MRFRQQKIDSGEIEIKCNACNGTGFRPVIQPVKPGRRVYPPPCKTCGGKGRITKVKKRPVAQAELDP